MLNLESSDDASIDQYVSNAFNVHNQDPLYVFVLPGAENETVVLRRSNFEEAIFPNVTILRMLRKMVKTSKWLQTENTDRKSEKFWKSDERFRAKYEQFKQDANDVDEDESMNVVEENVRTERNFLKFMDTLNVNDIENNDNGIEDSHTETTTTPEENSDSESQHIERLVNDYQSLLKDVHSKGHIGKYGLSHAHWDSPTTKGPAKTKVSWKDLGLEGWTGQLGGIVENPDEKL